MELAVSTASGSFRTIFIPPEIILAISSHLFHPLHRPWMVGGCCSNHEAGPGADICGPLPNVHYCTSAPDVRALAATCHALHEVLSPLANAFLGVDLRQGLVPLDAADEYLRNIGSRDPVSRKPEWKDIKVLRRSENGSFQIDRVLATDKLFDIAELPFRGRRDVKSLALSAITYSMRPPSPGSWHRNQDPAPETPPDDNLQLHNGMLGIIAAYPALESLGLEFWYGCYGNYYDLSPVLVEGVSRLENLRELRLTKVALGKDTPMMRGVTSIQVRDTRIDCFDKFPNLRDFRMEHQPFFGSGVQIPAQALRRLEHLTYCPPDNIDECRWLPDACLELQDQLESEGRKSPIPLRELIINHSIATQELIEIVQGLATPNLDTFVCFGIMVCQGYSRDMGREDELEDLVRRSFPNIRGERFVFWNNTKQVEEHEKMLRARRQSKQQEDDANETQVANGEPDLVEASGQ